MAKTILSANIKGGVGKTTNTVHLAVAAAKSNRNNRILVVDVDPQAHVTFSFMGKHQFESIHYLDQLFRGSEGYPQPTNESRIDIIPIDEGINEVLESKIFIQPNWAKNLKKLLSRYQDDYDYIFIDTACSMNKLHTISCIASDFYITPMKPEAFSTTGYAKTRTEIEDLKEHMECENPIFLGYFLNGVPNTVRTAVDKIRTYFTDLEASEAKFEIPLSVEFDNCRWNGKTSIFNYQNETAVKLQDVYKRAWKKLVQIMESHNE